MSKTPLFPHLKKPRASKIPRKPLVTQRVTLGNLIDTNFIFKNRSFIIYSFFKKLDANLSHLYNSNTWHQYIFHADDLDAEKDIEELTNEWGTKIGGWPSLEQGPQGVDERLPHILQICGDDEIGDEVSFDGHGWLCRGPEGQWIWYTVTS